MDDTKTYHLNDKNKNHENTSHENYNHNHVNEPSNYRINCNVASCTHNCIQDSTCMLNEILVSKCSHSETGVPEKDTACQSYYYIGNENTNGMVRER